MPFPHILRPLVFSISVIMIEWGVFPTLFLIFAIISLAGSKFKKRCFTWKFSKTLVAISSLILTGMVLSGVVTGTSNSLRNPYLLFLYIPWSLFQEFAIFCFIYENLEKILKGFTLNISVAVIFSLFHLPNKFLVSGTFFMILFFTSYYKKHRTILLPAILHYIFAMVALIFVPESITHALKVGINCCR